jgi:predicted transcriptional regulator
MTKKTKKQNPIDAPVEVDVQVPVSKMREEVRRILDEAGITQGKAAEISGYTIRTVNLMLNSEDQPIGTLINILDSLGYEVELTARIRSKSKGEE